MDLIYISPHLDDVAFSCGGLIWEQTQAHSRVSIWTLCAGDPPPSPLSTFAQSLHTRWGTGREAIAQRRQEDNAASKLIGASFYHFPIPDCIYRQDDVSCEPLYNSEESLFGEIHPSDFKLIKSLGQDIKQKVPRDAQVVCPLGLGGHVDHILTRRAVEMIKRPLWYYADYPYIRENLTELESLKGEVWKSIFFPISEEGFQAWASSIIAYSSQISTFWHDLDEMRADLYEYYRQEGGIRLWHR